MENRPSTDSVDDNAVDEVGAPGVLPCANVAGKEAESVGSKSGKAKPSNLSAYVDELALWRECYGDLWKLKLAFEKEHGR